MDAVARLAARQDGVVTRAQALTLGLAQHQIDYFCRSGRWARLARGAYLVDPSRPPGRRAIIRAAVLSLGPSAVAVLDTAAELHGILGLPSSTTVHVSVAADAARSGLRRDPHIQAHQMVVPRSRLTTVAGIPTTDPPQTVADIILRVDRFVAVSVLDSALNQGQINPHDVAALPAMLHGRRGAVAARGFLAEADGRAQSPLETRVRLRCVDGQVKPDVLQHVVRDSGGYILGVGDLAWLSAQVIGEADGRLPHALPTAVLYDRRRQNRLANAGWTILRFTWKDTLTAAYVPAVVRAALARGQ